MHPIIDDHGTLQGFENSDGDDNMTMTEIAHYSFDEGNEGGEDG